MGRKMQEKEIASAQTISKSRQNILTELVNLYYERTAVRPMLVIDGQLSVYKNNSYYAPIKTKQQLREYIYNIIGKEILKYGAVDLLNECIKIILLHGFDSRMSSESQGVLCFRNIGFNTNNYHIEEDMQYNTNCLQADLLKGYIPDSEELDQQSQDLGQRYLRLQKGLRLSKGEMPPAPWVDNFIAQIAGNDIELIIRIWQMIGYLLVPDNRAKKLFLLQGVTDSGKSVLAKFIAGFFPKDKVSYLSLKELTHKNAAGELFDKCLNITAEVPDRVLSAKEISTLKQLTGNDTMQIHTDFGSTNFVNRCKLLLITNNELRMKEPDRAFTNRIITIPFDNRVAEEFQHKGLLQLLNNEKDAVATKAILYYYRMLQANNYVFIGRQNQEYKPRICYTLTETVDKERSVEDFVRSKCTLTGDDTVRTYTDDLYKAYTAYCKEKSIAQTMSKQGFSRNLSGICEGKVIKSKWREGENNANGFVGIMLNSNEKGVIKEFNV